MKIQNGIIIDGVLHELVSAYVEYECEECSLYDECNDICGEECLCSLFGFENIKKVHFKIKEDRNG